MALFNSESFNTWFDNLPLSKKLFAGFSSLLFFMVLIVALNQYGSAKNTATEHYISDVLVPVIETELELQNNINRSFSSLRAYMILNDDAFKDDRKKTWELIDKEIEFLDKYIDNFNEDIISLYEEVKVQLDELAVIQEEIENIAHTDQEQPALSILNKDVAPTAGKVLQAITGLINEEKNLPATRDRKNLLGMMADSRGSFAVGLASVRAYLLTGQDSWLQDFQKRWKVNKARYQSLQENSYLFNDTQKAFFEAYGKNRKIFEPLTEKMFSIRQSDQWNMANYLLESKGNVLTEKLLKSTHDLAYKVNDEVLAITAQLDKQNFWFTVFSLTLAAIAFAIGIITARFISQRLNSGMNRVITAARNISEGHLDNNLTYSSQDEIGELIQTIGSMQERLKQIIEVDVQAIINQARIGNLSERITTNDKVGCYKDISEGINQLLEINEQVINDTVDVFSALSHGNLDTTIESDYQGDFSRIKKDANETINKLRQIIRIDIQQIISDSSKGDLSQRINLDGKEGFFHELCQSTNQLVDINQQVINDTIRVFTAMSQGDLNSQITANYDGDFQQLKEKANATLKQLTDVIEKDIQSVVSAVQGGDLSQRIDVTGKRGFFKNLSDSINAMTETSENVISDAGRVVAALAKGNLTQTITQDYAGSYGELSRNINDTVKQLQQVIGDIQESSNIVQGSASEIALGVSDLSQRTEEQAAVLEQTTSNVSQITESVSNSTQNTAEANKKTNLAQHRATEGGEAVDKTTVAMKGISEASKKISDIIGVIDEIAFQTNLLALNAAVEAARAGEQGRGFAVVAGEVRTLAQRSADAAKEIKQLITDSVARVGHGSELVDKSGETLKEIISSVQEVAGIIENVSIASVEQNENIQQINSAISNMDEMTQQNAALVEESSAASQNMSEQANKLNEMIAFFTLSDRSASPRTQHQTTAAIKTAPSQSTSPSYASSAEKPVKKETITEKAPKVERQAPPKQEVVSKPAASANPSIGSSHDEDDGNWEEF